jgi:hypothetical protein
MDTNSLISRLIKDTNTPGQGEKNILLHPHDFSMIFFLQMGVLVDHVTQRFGCIITRSYQV